jgi:hypothetical protein
VSERHAWCPFRPQSQGERSVTADATGRRRASTRRTSAFFLPYTVLLLELGDWFKIAARAGKGVRNVLCEAPFGPFRQNVPDPFSGPKSSAFRGRIRANLRPDGQARRKTRRKSSKKGWKMAKNGAFSKVQSAISPRSERTALDRKPPACQTLRLWSPAASSRLRPRQSPMERHFSQTGARPDICKTVEISRLR